MRQLIRAQVRVFPDSFLIDDESYLFEFLEM